MTKLRAPMFSFEARGAIAESIVFFPWKGLAVARKYVIPTNPNTTKQQIQRAFMRLCVAAIHAAQALAANPLNEDDIVANSQLGLTYPTPRTWFNMITKLWLDCKVAADIPIVYSNGRVMDTDKDDFRPWLYTTPEDGATLAVGKFYLGVTRTALIHTQAATVSAGFSVTLAPAGGFSGLVAGTKYYWQFRPDAGDPCEGAESGIYSAYAT
ncbi:hypothetical protein ES703_102785 [subsurface metagenome]